MTPLFSLTPIFWSTQILPFHIQAVEKLQSLDDRQIELWISRQILKEYLAAMTRPGDLTGQISLTSLIEDVRYFSDRFFVAEENANVTEQLLSLLEKIPTSGRQIHDANIVATMQAYGIQNLLTHNVADFQRFSRFITVLPLEHTESSQP